MKKTNIVIIGTGNLAFHLIDFIAKHKELNLVQIFNHRLSKKAKQLALTHTCTITSNYSKLNTGADFYFICVNDDAIEIVAQNLQPLQLKGLVCHTSGSVHLSSIANATQNTGVFYPLQTFSVNDKINWKEIPILIEANTVNSLKKLKQLALLFSKNIKNIDSENRLQIHLAAVFASNFTNALYGVSQQLLQKDKDLLNPLLKQSFNKMLLLGAEKAQTGPAKRNDKTTMQKHLNLLKNDKQLTLIYKSLSQLIETQQHAKF